MTDKYMEAVGIWEHTIGKITHSLIPTEEDNYRFIKLRNNPDTMFTELGKVYFDMVLRAYPHLTEEEKESLKIWISVNISQIVQDYLITFKWITEEKLKELDENIQKKNEMRIKDSLI